MEQQKKLTNAQLQKKIQRALVFVERDKATAEVFFSDKGVRLTVNQENAIISTNFHRHIFSRWTSSGESKPFLYTQLIVALSRQVDCSVDLDGKGNKGYSFQKLLDELKKDESKKMEYLIAYYYSLWCFNIFSPLYEIGETETTTFMTYLSYVANIAKTLLVLGEHEDDVTNKKFIKQWLDGIGNLTSDIEERVVFSNPKADESEEVAAMDELETEETLQSDLERRQSGKDKTDETKENNGTDE